MKKVTIISLIAVFAAFTFSTASAQTTEKEAKKELKDKPVKAAKKQAKQYKKQGYYTAPGLTMEQQIEDLMIKQSMKNEDGSQKYMVAEATSVGETQIAAKMQANEAAKLNLAGQLETSVAALIEQNIANAQLNTEEAASVTKLVAGSKSIIAQKIGQVNPVVTLYRNIDKNIEVTTTLVYDKESAEQIAKNAMREELEKETEIVQEKLDKLMGL